MAGQTDRLLARARERFAVQDYYGAVHLLEEIVATGRAFADVHHLLGVSLSLLGQPERALAEFEPRARAQPALPRGADPPGAGAQRAGPHRGGRGSVPPRRRQRSAALDRAARHRWRPSWPTTTPSWPRPTPRPARWTGPSSSTSGRWSSAPPSTTCATGWRGSCWRPAARSRRVRPWRTCSGARQLRRRGSRAGAGPLPLGRRASARGTSGGRCLARRPENARVEAYLAMLGRTGA